MPTHVRRRFPTIAAMCAQVGIDIATDPIPVGPAAHYLMGGIDTDEWGRTSLPGLFAAGETACTGVHGANRLASNSLLEGLVFGARAAIGDAAGAAVRAELKPDRVARPVPGRLTAGRRLGPRAGHVDAIRDLMWRSAGLFRSRATACETAVARPRCAPTRRRRARRTDALARRSTWRRFNLLTVARLIARAALRREESRGGHFREDFPERRRSTLEGPPRSTARRRSRPSSWPNKTKTTRSSPKSRPGRRTSPSGTSTSSAAPSWPTTRRSRAAWSSGRTATPSGS